MARIAYVNGRYLPFAAACVHVEDRGYQFSDGVYEVIAVRGGRLVDTELHYDRLWRSLGELAIDPARSRGALDLVLRETIRRNRLRDGIVYLQITRGVAKRDHAFPDGAQSSLVVTARRGGLPAAGSVERGIGIVLLPDLRWQRRDIKSVSLLPNVLAKQAAREQGAFETWLVDTNGFVTEGSSTNAWIVDDEGNLVTRQLENAILSGITRRVLRDLAESDGIKVIERPFSAEEAKSAAEAFITSTTSFVLPVVTIDGVAVGTGAPGPVTKKLCSLYAAHFSGRGRNAP